MSIFKLLKIAIATTFVVFAVLTIFTEDTKQQESRVEPRVEARKEPTEVQNIVEKDEIVEDEISLHNDKEEIITQPKEIEEATDESLVYEETNNTLDILQTPIQEDIKETISFSDININVRNSLVNILCTSKQGGSFKPITGSGVIIDEKGVILTNAHMAQYFLLKNYPTDESLDCVIREGSPAKPKYKARLLYISSRWVQDNAEKIKDDNPTGTGENDYAFLLVTENTNSTVSLPEKFSFVEFDISDLFDIEDNVLLAGYPAGFLGGISIQKDLYISSSIVKIQESFTFKENTTDLFSIGSSVVAQQGSSGGAVMSDTNKLLGIITTSSEGDTTEERDLRAITLSHINRSFIEEVGFNIYDLLSSEVAARAEIFNKDIVPTLTQMLVDELEK